jgi:hypothetical protein
MALTKQNKHLSLDSQPEKNINQKVVEKITSTLLKTERLIKLVIN